MFKKGQLTVFIIIAILIVTIAILFYIFRDNFSSEQSLIVSESDIQILENSVLNCLEVTSLDALRLLGLQGGYLFEERNYFETSSFKIAYGYYKGNEVLPSIKKIESELENYVNLALPICFENDLFSDLFVYGNEVKTEVFVEGGEVSFLVEYPFLISNNFSSSYLEEEYAFIAEIDFEGVYQESLKIIEDFDNDYIDLTSLSDSNYEISVLPYEEDVLIYSITDFSSEINGIPYTFMFAGRLK